MNWDAIGAIAESIGAIAVIASLLYLAIQVRTGAKALSTTTRDSMNKSIVEFCSALYQDAEMAYLFQRGAEGKDELSAQELARFLPAAFNFFKLYENMFLHYLEGAVQESDWVYNQEMLLNYGRRDGMQHYLEQRTTHFDPRFLALLGIAADGAA